ncbi:hypothetical protein SAMN06297251_10553 [Fulvimarina manganoxydans]|uniref:Copper(I)-binding protein n=1 Tax=Fulvimarina manganoxydans TaxID=937218 RepID=A0A1W2AT76_9HYPH|nr:copper chaperone PCu(A)C [Fulvimarina manganoxydans]SMC63661.1 hypothetical protein SAMN06297251_10553 [Fulvimarina manganoxydans]
MTTLFRGLGAALTFTALSAAIALTGAASAHEYKMGEVAIGHPWTRATLPNAKVAGAYMSFTNSGKEPARLVGGSSPLSEGVEIHEMSMQDGVMKMQALENGLDIPAGETVTLEPGGYHIMMTGLKKSIAEGDKVPLTLTFANGETVNVELAAEAVGAKSSGMAGKGETMIDHGATGHDVSGETHEHQH